MNYLEFATSYVLEIGFRSVNGIDNGYTFNDSLDVCGISAWDANVEIQKDIKKGL